jgi:D-tyrosyl-tRNA(Tyr) deacylase
MTIFIHDFLGCIRIIFYLCRMRAVIQRVSKASVTIEGAVKSAIGKGFLVLIGICD